MVLTPRRSAPMTSGARKSGYVAALPDVMSELNDQDVMIADDLNPILGDPSLSPLLSSAGLAQDQSTRRAQGSNSISYLKEPFQEIIDHVLIRLANTTEWANRSTIIFDPPADQTLIGKYLKYTSITPRCEFRSLRQQLAPRYDVKFVVIQLIMSVHSR